MAKNLRERMMNTFYLVVIFAIATTATMWKIIEGVSLMTSVTMLFILSLGFSLGLFYAFALMASE
jgi:hypothetical protein